MERGISGRYLAVLAAWLLPWCARAETPGKDGDVIITTSTVVNQYAAVSGSPTAGSTSITAVGLLAAMPTLAAGDLILIYQAQGATISSANDSTYGSITALNSAGRYEFQTVASVSGNTITFATYSGACSGLRFSYQASGKPQIVRVPQYSTMIVASGRVISATPWDGSKGGIVAMTVSNGISLAGQISASGAGFRGGAVDNAASVNSITDYLTTDPSRGAEKGEGIAGYQATLPGGIFYGRGAPANGGGGGNGNNAGGGGGSNGDSGQAWAGQGRPNNSDANWASAWNLDPTLNASTNNAGGGRGGYSYSVSNANALTNGPGTAPWGADLRNEAGGLGGRPLTYDRAGRIFFGGGGGAGDGNNSAAGGGGRGGGIVFITAPQITGSSSIRADGAAGQATTGTNQDAAGGGGGGGTVIVRTTIIGSPVISANGGAGGNQLITTDEAYGPGGGGGGGVVAVSSAGGSRLAAGGVNGTTTSNALTEFTPNGATQGASGQVSATAPSEAETPFCYSPGLSMTKASATWETIGPNRFFIPAADVVYTITVTNAGQQLDSGSMTVIDPLPAELTFYNGDIDDSGPLTTNYQFVDGSPSSGLTCCALAYSAFTSGTDFTYVPVAGYDPAVRRIRFTPSGAMAAGSTTATSFQIRLRARIN